MKDVKKKFDIVAKEFLKLEVALDETQGRFDDLTMALNNLKKEIDMKVSKKVKKKECQHSYVDVSNDGMYGKEWCRFCGKIQRKE